jgi:DNA/RNA-binding domain of Phe-tRNA-synthetase-like protein
MTFALAPELNGVVRPGVLQFRGATVAERQPSLDEPLAAAAAAMRERLLPDLSFEGESHSDLPAKAGSHVQKEGSSRGSRLQAEEHGQDRGFRLQPEHLRRHIDLVRTMYKRVGIDPTRRRPSSEALLRRVLKGEPLPRVNAAVDVCNWCSFEFQLPYGLYDASRIGGDVTLRLGRPGESYPGIRKDDVHVGGRITLADADGPFGNPTSDSARTMVTEATRDVLLVVFAPSELARELLASVLEITASRMQQYTGASCDDRHVF